MAEGTGKPGIQNYCENFGAQSSKQAANKQNLFYLFVDISIYALLFGTFFFMILAHFLEPWGSILEVLGRLGLPFGPSGRPGRFKTSFFRSFFRLLVPFGAPSGAQGSTREPKGTQMVAKVSPKTSKRHPKTTQRHSHREKVAHRENINIYKENATK